MGTRNLTIVVHGGKNVVAKYCQWDGYPNGQGRMILEFLRKKFDRPKFVERLKRVREITDTEYASLYHKVLGYVPGEMIAWTEGKKFGDVYPSLNRDMGGRILEFIQEGSIVVDSHNFSNGSFKTVTKTLTAVDDEILVTNASDFGKDDTWCEWIWTLDLDKDIFRGQNGPRPTIINEWKLTRLPTVPTFLKRFDQSEEQ
jgi:hypothetical protein